MDKELENERRWRIRAEGEKDKLASDLEDAFLAISQVQGINLNQSLAGAVFDLTQKMKNTATRCAEIAFDADTNWTAKEAILKEFEV